MSASAIAIAVAALVMYLGFRKRNAKMAVAGAVLLIACLAASVPKFLPAIQTFWESTVGNIMTLLGSFF